jgi:hypothetical protein
MAFFETLANERRRNSVPAPDLEYPVIRPDIQLLDDRLQPLTHDTAVVVVCFRAISLPADP